MKIFENKAKFKKVIIALLIVIVCGFFFSGKVDASGEALGGKLLSPVADLFMSLGDGAMNIIHDIIYQQKDTTLGISTVGEVWQIIATALVGIAVAIAVAAAVVFTAGAAVAAFAALGISLSAISVGTVVVISVAGGVAAASVFNSKAFPDYLELPVYRISPEEIFSNKVLLFDVDFFNPKDDEYAKDIDGNYVRDENGKPVKLQSTAKQLRDVIAKWFYILRDLAIVSLLSILVYIGIRIVISSTASDKSKYKQMIIDWVVALCLLFLMQYIMSFSNLIVGRITELVVKNTSEKQYHVAMIEDKSGKIEKVLKDNGYNISSIKSDGYIVWNTNLIGIAKLNAQMGKKESKSYAGYTLIFVVLVLFTIYFIVTYLKRVVYIAFLTIIAPLVAMTYPIDKINDGKAQAFNMWFKEYIFNLLIQPLHLLLYTILVSSAFEMASQNVIYSLVALGFIMPSEKIMRSFFGFEKAKTPGVLGGPAGAALMMSGIHKLLGKAPKDTGKIGGANKSGEEKEKPPRINPNFNKENELMFDENSSGGEGKNPGKNPGGNPGDNPDGDTGDNQGGDTGDNQGRDTGDNQGGDTGDNQGGDPDGEEENADGETSGNLGGDADNNPDGDDGNSPDGEAEGNLGDEEDEEDDIQRESFLKAIAKAGVASTRYYRRTMTRKAIKGIKENFHPVRGAAKLAAGAAGAAVLGGAGLAIGITSGDLSKTAQYTAAATLGGYKMGKGIASKVDGLTPEGAQEVAQRSVYKTNDDYRKAKQKKYLEKYQKDADNLFELESRFGSKDAKRIMEENVPQYIDSGITDMNDIIAIEEAIKNRKVQSVKEGIAVKKYSSLIGGDSTKLSKKKRDEWKATFKERFSKNSKYDGKNYDDLTEQLFKKIDAYSKIRYSM